MASGNHSDLFTLLDGERSRKREKTVEAPAAPPAPSKEEVLLVEATKYLSDTTPADSGEITKAVNRYIVMPGQATSYMIGMLKILELRTKAQKELGNKFKIKDFHDQVLKNGPLPLDHLESELEFWIKNQKS